MQPEQEQNIPADELPTKIDFVFVNPRPEFADFFIPVLESLRAAGYVALILNVAETEALQEGNKRGDLPVPKVVICTNELPCIARFTSSAKVLLGHSLYIRDTIPGPIALGADHFFSFDYFFTPSTFYTEWTIRSIFDGNYVGLDKEHKGDLVKYVIPGGYAKSLPRKRSPSPRPAKAPFILYAPSVYSPEHTGHRFHLDGCEILFTLASYFPQARIVCRPHPTDREHSYIKEMIDMLNAQHVNNIEFDLSDTPDPRLYSDPDIVLTDMSGFAFVHELKTHSRPIFFIPEEEVARHPRFVALVCQFARLVRNTQQLVSVVQAQIEHGDQLTEKEAQFFESLFATPFNSVESLHADLLRIHAGQQAEHWIRLPMRFGTKD